MKCKNCGETNYERWFEPVFPPLTYPVGPANYEDVPAEDQVFYKKWACRKCGRYHFEDGTLFSYPYSDKI